MSNIPDKATFANSYANKAPWDVPGPQPGLVQLADQIRGSILDAGCGTGENAMFFAGRGNRVTGIDYLEEPIARARRKAAERGLSVDFRVMDALTLSQIGQVFDGAIDCGLFHVFSDADRHKYVAELAGVIKTQGKVFLMCFSDEEPGTIGPRRISQADLRAAFSSGWHVESIAAARFWVIPEFAQSFTSGGPKAWFAVIQRV